MKLDERKVLDDLLVVEETCLGAVFCSYTFDPAYFEEHVLRAVLRLRSDPEEEGQRYHAEAREALQRTPVACVVDAGARQPGRRLPYDLLLVRARTFHPKVYLVAYESGVAVAIGSGNLTKSGIEENAELFFARSLRYDEEHDIRFLRDVCAFLRSCATLSGQANSQLELALQAVDARLPREGAQRGRKRADVAFVSTFGTSVLDTLRSALPQNAVLTRVGVLAPFYEQDDAGARDIVDGVTSVLAELLALRPTRDAVLELAVPWEDAPVKAPLGDVAALDAQLGQLWARRHPAEDKGSPETLEYFVVESCHARTVSCVDQRGERRRIDRDDLEQARNERRAWHVPRPKAFAPQRILEQLQREHTLRLWLHPTMRLTERNVPRVRHLHAKLLLLTVRVGRSELTYALLGSANASRAALARSVEAGGNVEAGVLMVFDGDVRLADVLPELVSCPPQLVDLHERESPSHELDFSAWISEVVHDASAATLRVTWSDQGPQPLPPWTLRYLDEELASGAEPPAGELLVPDFKLRPGSAEVAFQAGEHVRTVPIRALDLATLPAAPELEGLSIRELLALLGRRVGVERLSALRSARGVGATNALLDAVFGDGFGPNDVFKAWWGVKQDLERAPTVAAFRHVLLGPSGVAWTWAQLLEAVPQYVTEDEAWVYGCELLRELRRVDVGQGADAEAKRGCLTEQCDQLERHLREARPSAGDPRLLRLVSEFYGLEASHA